MIWIPEHWDSPTGRDDASSRLDAISELIRRQTIELRILRSLYRRVRPLAQASDVSHEQAETLGKAAYVAACIVGEAKLERANLRRWLTVDRKVAAAASGESI